MENMNPELTETGLEEDIHESEDNSTNTNSNSNDSRNPGGGTLIQAQHTNHILQHDPVIPSFEENDHNATVVNRESEAGEAHSNPTNQQIAQEGEEQGLRDFAGDSSSFLPTLTNQPPIEANDFSISSTVNQQTGNQNEGVPASSGISDNSNSGSSSTGITEADQGANQQEQSQEEQNRPQTCLVCGKDYSQDPRAMVRFLPSKTASNDVSLHVFCGKTASILPEVAQPHLEILLKAGLKNKHGIGPDVNFALARTRSAVAVGGEADKDPKRLEKEYYLVKEFEGHLASIRNLHVQQDPQPQRPNPFMMPPGGAPMPPSVPIPPHPRPPGTTQKNRPHKASKKSVKVGHPGQPDHEKEQPQQLHHHQQQQPIEWFNIHDPLTQYAVPPMGGGRVTGVPVVAHAAATLPPHATATTDVGKFRCQCGGSYWPPGTPKGQSSWRNHVKTRKHQQWQEEHNQNQYYAMDPSSMIMDGSNMNDPTAASMDYSSSNNNQDNDAGGAMSIHHQQQAQRQGDTAGTIDDGGQGEKKANEDQDDEYSQMLLQNQAPDAAVDV